jgi:hypothetical protein
MTTGRRPSSTNPAAVRPKTATENRERHVGPNNAQDSETSPATAEPKEPTAPAASSHKLTTQERAALTDHLARRRKKNPAPRLKITASGTSTTFAVDHPDPLVGQLLLSEAFGTTDCRAASACECRRASGSGERR